MDIYSILDFFFSTTSAIRINNGFIRNCLRSYSSRHNGSQNQIFGVFGDFEISNSKILALAFRLVVSVVVPPFTIVIHPVF